ERFGVTVRTGVEVVAVEADSVRYASGEQLAGEVVLAASLEAPRTRVTLVTLAFDEPQLAPPPRGTGVAVAAGAPAASRVAASGPAHLSATWPWPAQASPLQFVRLSYEQGATATVERAHRDAETLFGMRLPHPSDAAFVAWD